MAVKKNENAGLSYRENEQEAAVKGEVYSKARMVAEKIPLSKIEGIIDYWSLVKSSKDREWSKEFRKLLLSEMDSALRNKDYALAKVIDEHLFYTYVYNAPYEFEEYLMAIEYDKPLDKKFYIPRQRYLKRYVDAYQRVLDGELDFLSVSMPKRSGKLISKDCPVLTVDGWKTHGDLKIGDKVFGIDGKPKRVVWVHPDDYATHKITLTNGEEILTSAEHEWLIYDKARGVDCIYETGEMLKLGCRKNSRNRFYLPFLSPINMPEKELPVPPYVLGAWLGDGTTNKPVMTNDVKDIGIVCEIMRLGYNDVTTVIDKNTGVLVTSFRGLRKDLQKLGMCYKMDKKNKHIPDEYFTASAIQRLELLSGLVDTDGYIEKDKHRVHISTALPRLKDDIIKLVGSLGLDCRCYKEAAKVSSSGIIGRSDIYHISFVPYFDMPVVLKRKKNMPTELPRRVSIKSIEPLDEPVLGNCITVEDGLYRVGKRGVLTHNSTLGIHFTNLISGREPDKSTLMEGTGDDLVKSFYAGCLEYLQQPSDYHFYDIFPNSPLVQTNFDSKIINLGSRKRFPTIMCRSIDSRQVGLSEATNMLYLDDCVEGREEAKNRRRLDEKWEVISGDILGRAIEGTPIVICGTRYSIYDPIGRLQEEMLKHNKRIEILETPALDEETDESNFEFELGGKKIFTTGYFREQRDMLSAEQFESEFQQKPFEAKGLLFHDTELNRFYELPGDIEPDSTIAVCDTAEGGEDYCSLVVAKIYGEDVYIVDVVFDDSPPEVTKPECARVIVNNEVSSCLFESNASGEYFARDIGLILKEQGYKCGIRTKRTITNKKTRIEFASDNIIKHFYFKGEYKRGSQYDVFMRQLVSYTRTGKNLHDDAPDSLSLLENELRTIEAYKVEILKRII